MHQLEPTFRLPSAPGAAADRALLAAVIELAIRDLSTPLAPEEKTGRFNRSSGVDEENPDPHGAAAFLFGGEPTFENYCHLLGIDAGAARAALVSGAKRDVATPGVSRARRALAETRLARVEFFRRWQAARDAMTPTNGS